MTGSTLGAIAISVTMLGSSLAAQQLEERPVPSRRVASFTFQSPSMGVKFGVNVGMPPSYRPGATRKYPALITNDGDFVFPTVQDAAGNLIQEGAIEDLFVVSIGTTLDDGDSTWIRRRVYEFSPPGWDRNDAFGQVVTNVCQTFRSAPDRCTGGAPQFLRAIVTELIPLVTGRYPIDPAQLGLFGVSAGGFFASWTMFQPNAPFTNYLISSPAVAYGDGEIFRQKARWAADHKDLPIAVYFGAGALEMESPRFEGVGQIVSGMIHLTGVLSGRRFPGLRLTTEIHPGMSHSDVVSTVVVRGLRTLYPK